MIRTSEVILSTDPRMRKMFEIARNVASSRATVLIMGESGTGKEKLAQFVHENSPRASRRWVAINCAAVPENLLESELFGHEKGSFTGAHAAKVGKFELANQSTLLLDEMGELPLHLQGKLLRALQENEIERVGGTQPIKTNIRLIATTNRDLLQMVKAGRFREDLYYRLNVITLKIPSLRERPHDIRQLSETFLTSAIAAHGTGRKVLGELAWQTLLSWPWPGNVRELENCIERAVLLSPHEVIMPTDLSLQSDEDTGGIPVIAGHTISEMERRLIFKTLELTENNRTKAARILGISIRTLRNKLQEYKEVR